VSRFASKSSGRTAVSPVVSVSKTPDMRTHEGGPGFSRDPRSELFLLALQNFVSQDTFYEPGKARDERFVRLVREVLTSAPSGAAWAKGLFKWLRNDANMRTASIVGAIEAGRSWPTCSRVVDDRVPEQVQKTCPHAVEFLYDSVGGLCSGHASKVTGTVAIGSARNLLNSVLVRPDEPAEAVGYWLEVYPDEQMPKWFKRGLGDAILRLYHEKSFLKWDSKAHEVRFADVIEFSAPGKSDTAFTAKEALFKYILDERHGNAQSVPEELPVLTQNRVLNSMPVERRRPLVLQPGFSEVLGAAGMTWESVSGWLSDGKGMDGRAWDAIIPSMGYMALIRNLRNFDQAGIKPSSVDLVLRKLQDPDEVAKSRQLPMRFMSAYNAVTNDRWKYPLDVAASLSLQSVPEFDGETLVLVDTSGSMDSGFSKDGSLRRWDAAALFGIALAMKCASAKVVSFSNESKVFELQPGANLLSEVARFKRSYFYGGGTSTHRAVKSHYSGQKRVVILTDEASSGGRGVPLGGVFDGVPASTHCYTFNLAGYRAGHDKSGTGNRHVIGGLSDAGFKMMTMIEAQSRGTAKYPWES
jgi:hypothetical protein